MSLASMLSQRARIMDPGEALHPDTRVPIDNLTPAVTGNPEIRARYVLRSERTTPRDDDNTVLVDGDVLLERTAVDGTPITRDHLPVGHRIVLDTGETVRIVGRAKARRRQSPAVALWSVPVLYAEG